MNPFDLRGPDFLEFYLVVLAGAVAAALALRWLLRSPGGDQPNRSLSLDPFETAYLSGGPRMAVDTALASLVHSSALALAAGGVRFKVQSPPVGKRTPLEKAVFDRVAYGQCEVSDLHLAADDLTKGTATKLMDANLALSPSQRSNVRTIPAMLIALVLLLGIIKTFVGISRNKPVAILIALCLLTAIIAAFFALKRIYRTRAGDRALNRLRANNSALRTAARTAPDRLACGDLAFALALFGPTILSTGALLSLKQALWPIRQGDGGWSGGSGCGSSGCGGGSCGGSSCGGGGGCGGGGCGGCGGG